MLLQVLGTGVLSAQVDGSCNRPRTVRAQSCGVESFGTLFLAIKPDAINAIFGNLFDGHHRATRLQLNYIALIHCRTLSW